MIRKVIKALVLIPLAIVIVSFAVANRLTVTVSFDPFDRVEPAISLSVPLYALIMALIITGVIVGGLAAWLGQGKWRWRARLAESQARDLQAEIADLKRRDAAGSSGTPSVVGHAPRLSIPPPAE